MTGLKVPYRRTFGAGAFGVAGFASVPFVSVFLMIKVTSPIAFVVPFRSAPDAGSDAGIVIFVLPDNQLAFDPLYGALTGFVATNSMVTARSLAHKKSRQPCGHRDLLLESYYFFL